MKSVSLFIFIGLVLTGLSLKEESPLLSHKISEGPVREIANNNAGKCMRDLFSAEELKKEIQELESSMDTNRIHGTWKHLDLSTLPTPAADFLVKNGDKLGDPKEPVSFEGCEDVPCIYNRIYGNQDSIAGYVHYLWFLRTGVYLAADNLVPNQHAPAAGQYNGRSLPLSSYLFDEDELYGWWRLSKMLKAPFSTLTFLKEIQRIPRGEKMEGENHVACGLAHSDGWINLSDQCLAIYPQSDSGYFFSSVLHELTHELDFELGVRHNDEFFRSQWKDFLAISGFELSEYRDSQGRLVRQWVLKPGSRIVTSYGRGSPQENFAELLAYYRTDGDETKNRVDQNSWDFAGKFFQGTSFENKAIADSWVSEASHRKTKEILKASVNCKSEICFHEAMRSLASDEIARIRSEDPDGCKVLSHPLDGHTLPEKLTSAFVSAGEMMTEGSTPEGQERVLESLDTLMDPAVAYGSFFACRSEGKECYREKISAKIESEIVRNAYLATWPYKKIADDVTSFYRSLLSSRERIMTLKSDELWNSCKKIPASDAIPPTGTDYVVKDGYMISSFYNCLNLGFRSALTASLDAIKLREFTPKNPEERSFILSLMRPRFTDMLDDHLRRGRARELKYRDAFIEQQGKWLYNTMRTNRWWMPRGRPTRESIETTCRNTAVTMIGGDHFFHLKKELYKELLDRTCIGI